MKHIYLNLKRFDVPPAMGGVNSLAPARDWAGAIVKGIAPGIRSYLAKEAEFAAFFPEAHLLPALAAREGVTIADSPEGGACLQIGCQGVFRMDTAKGGNFGAFTTNRSASSMSACGAESVLIGHCEERNDKLELLRAGAAAAGAVLGPEAEKALANRLNQILNQEIRLALDRGMKVLYCIGEKAEEQERWQEVLLDQLETGLEGVDRSRVVIGYEPVWSIGPGKTPADKPYITKIARFVKEVTKGMDVVYGGGLKSDNAAMLSSIPEIDGGLIALTRFTGEIGFYPEEYLEIVRLYLHGKEA